MASFSQSARPGRVGRSLLRVVYDRSTAAKTPPMPHIRPARAVVAWQTTRTDVQPQWGRALPA